MKRANRPVLVSLTWTPSSDPHAALKAGRSWKPRSRHDVLQAAPAPSKPSNISTATLYKTKEQTTLTK